MLLRRFLFSREMIFTIKQMRRPFLGHLPKSALTVSGDIGILGTSYLFS